MFPSPIADPAVAAIIPNLEPKDSRLGGSPDILIYFKLLFNYLKNLLFQTFYDPKMQKIKHIQKVHKKMKKFKTGNQWQM